MLATSSALPWYPNGVAAAISYEMNIMLRCEHVLQSDLDKLQVAPNIASCRQIVPRRHELLQIFYYHMSIGLETRLTHRCVDYAWMVQVVPCDRFTVKKVMVYVPGA